MYAYFDLETTGVDANTCGFKCGVLIVNKIEHIFYTAVDMVKFMSTHLDYTYVTFNGLSFDFQVLAAQCTAKNENDLAALAAKIATSNKHVDIMFAFLANFGYYASMDSFAQQLGCKKSWNGAEAAASDDIAAVTKYCIDDVKVLETVHTAALLQSFLKRASKMGRVSVWVFDSTKLDVQSTLANLKTLKPDQSWMSDPPNVPDNQVSWTVALLQQTTPAE